jgi:hypothetical protein
VASSVAVQNTTAVIQYNTVYYGTVIGTVLDSKNLYARLIRPYCIYCITVGNTAVRTRISTRIRAGVIVGSQALKVGNSFKKYIFLPLNLHFTSKIIYDP